jgi:hypothetical protein
MKGKLESHVLHYALVRSLKKSAPCLGPKFKQAVANFFLLQRYRSARQSPVQNISVGNGPRWRFGAKQAAANFFFLLPMHNMAAPLFSRWRFRDIQTVAKFCCLNGVLEIEKLPLVFSK